LGIAIDAAEVEDILIRQTNTGAGLWYLHAVFMSGFRFRTKYMRLVILSRAQAARTLPIALLGRIDLQSR